LRRAIIARAIPVLPLVGSRRMESGRSRPDDSRSSINALATRSLTDPVGFMNSNLA